MRQKKFALQPLLEQRIHRENVQRAACAQTRRARDAAAAVVADLERRYDAAGDTLVCRAMEGRIAEVRAYDAMLVDAGDVRLRRAAELRAHDAALAAAQAALTAANRERRVLERLRERLEMRRARRRNDDD